METFINFFLFSNSAVRWMYNKVFIKGFELLTIIEKKLLLLQKSFLQNFSASI